MIDVSTLTAALLEKLLSSTALDALNCQRERSTRINFDPGRCPWIGIYPGSVSANPRTAAGASAWNETVGLQIVCQTASFGDDGMAASDLLEQLIAAVLNVVVADLTLAVTGVRVVKLDREYKYMVFDDDGQGELFMPQAIIRPVLELRR